jgi:hypothetical protein
MENSTNNNLSKKIKSIKAKGIVRDIGIMTSSCILGGFFGLTGLKNGKTSKIEYELYKNNEIEKIKNDSTLSESEKTERIKTITEQCDAEGKKSMIGSIALGFGASAATGIFGSILCDLSQKETKREIGKAYGISKASDKKKGESK